MFIGPCPGLSISQGSLVTLYVGRYVLQRHENEQIPIRTSDVTNQQKTGILFDNST